MTAAPNGPSWYDGSEIRRRVIGSLLELGIKAYGAAAAVSVAFSDAETAGGKFHDAIAAVPNLTERYREAKYAVDHRAEMARSSSSVAPSMRASASRRWRTLVSA